MAADHLPLQVGARLLHIGPHKTGTTAIQGAFHLARERLALQGIVYPGSGRQPLRPILAVTGQPALLGEQRPHMAHWNHLVRDVRAARNQRVVVSSEFFAEADDAVACRVIEDLGGSQVHVVVTLRPLTKILPSQWQQYMQNGYCMPYLDWLEGILSQPPHTPTPGFWRRHRHDELITRWMTAAGEQNLTVVVVDESDRLMLLYAKFMRYGAVERMKTRQPSSNELKIVTPAWAVKRATEIGAEMARNISALGVRVIGDISALGQPTADLLQAREDSGPAGPLVPAEAAVKAVLGAFVAGGVDGLTAGEARPEAGGTRPEAGETLPGVKAKSLTRVLAELGRQRMRRTPRLPR